MSDASGEDHTAFNRLIGARLLSHRKGQARYQLEVGEDHLNRRRVAHGGVVATLLDSALGAAVVSAIKKEEWCGTLQLSVQFQNPVRPGIVTAEGRLARRGRTTAFAEGEIRDESGKVLAIAHGTWTIWPQKPS